MSGPFRVERIEGCSQCGHGQLFDVIGPDDVAHSTQYGDEEEANSVRDGFNRAYLLGTHAKFLSEHPWTAFTAETLPPDGDGILVWDAQYNNMTLTYWMSSIHNLETATSMQWSHWILAKDLIPPPPGMTTEPPPVDSKTIPQAAPTIQPAPDQVDDDIPF